MALVKFRSQFPVFNTAFENFINRALTDFSNHELSFAQPAVNIIERENAYHVEVAAPGFNKGDFSVNITENVLRIQAKNSQEQTEKQENYARREFSYQSFERSFTLPEDVNTDAIQAKYENGILQIELPKKEQKQPEQKLIEVI
jgi:HSP20 family protein